MGRWRRPTQRWPGPCSHEAGPLLPPPHLLNSRGPLAWNPHTQTGPSRAGLSCPFAATGRPPCRTGRRDPAALGRRHGVNLGPRPPASRPPNPGVGPVTPLHTHTHTHTHTRARVFLSCHMSISPRNRKSHKGDLSRPRLSLSS